MMQSNQPQPVEMVTISHDSPLGLFLLSRGIPQEVKEMKEEDMVVDEDERKEPEIIERKVSIPTHDILIKIMNLAISCENNGNSANMDSWKLLIKQFIKNQLRLDKGRPFYWPRIVDSTILFAEHGRDVVLLFCHLYLNSVVIYCEYANADNRLISAMRDVLEENRQRWETINAQLESLKQSYTTYIQFVPLRFEFCSVVFLKPASELSHYVKISNEMISRMQLNLMDMWKEKVVNPPARAEVLLGPKGREMVMDCMKTSNEFLSLLHQQASEMIEKFAPTMEFDDDQIWREPRAV